MALDQRSVSDSVAQPLCLLFFFFFCCYSFAENKQCGASVILKNVRARKQACFCENGLYCQLDTPCAHVFLSLYSIFKVCLWLLNERWSNKMRRALLKPSVPKAFWSTHVKHLMTLNLRRAPVVIFSVSARVSLGRRVGEWELRPRAIALPVAKHKSRQSALRLLPRGTQTAQTRIGSRLVSRQTRDVGNFGRAIGYRNTTGSGLITRPAEVLRLHLPMTLCLPPFCIYTP